MRHVGNCTEGGRTRSSSCEGLGGGAFMNFDVKEGFPMAGDHEQCVGDEGKR
jgi:hypothetical protein